MLTRLFIIVCCLQFNNVIANSFSVSGKITNASALPMSFVNVLLYDATGENLINGTTTDDSGSFLYKNIKMGSYKIKIQYLGFESVEILVELISHKDLGTIILRESTQMLDETVLNAKLPTIKKTLGKLVFNVENTSLSVGSTLDLLKKTPGVVVVGDKIQVKFSTPTIYINGKRVYLSASETASLLENTDAANIKTVEVITNNAAKYDAEAGTVLNIQTSKAISIGYKGSVNTAYEQGVYPKYRLGTSHFYKNKWLHAYASYSFGKRKEYKEDENFIQFFQPDGISTKSVWETDFNRTTRSENHNGNIVLDFTVDEKNTFSLTSNISVSPHVKYFNKGESYIFSPQRERDSTITTLSNVNFNKENLSFGAAYNRKLDGEGSLLSASANYIYYNNEQDQYVSSDYFLATNNFNRNNTFITASKQNSSIFTGQAEASTTLWAGTFEAGFKFSNIDTESKLDFFNQESGINTFNNALSDDFNYKENIYAEYINYEKQWEKWSLTAGLRGEYTTINAISRSLGEVNTQQYFEFFPSISMHYKLNETNGVGISYGRSIRRPRYESLNPFRYFITENNFKGGNPNLVPGISNKIKVSYDFKNKLFFEAYYENVNKGLSTLSFQNNTNSTLSSLEANLIREFQYSFDILYITPLTPWWYLQAATSTFYLADEFYALQSEQETYKNDTFGQYLFLYSNFTLSKDRSLTADLNSVYISNFVMGTQFFKNQYMLNVSFRKEFWQKRASITAGVDDVFNTNIIPVHTDYYNQKNNYFAQSESRLYKLGFKYNFGNARLRDNNKQLKINEGDRL